MAGALCAGCRSELTPGAKFCHRCGTGVGATLAGAGGAAAAGAAGQSLVPWAVTALALVALVALVAGKQFNARRGSSLDGSSNALPQAGLDDRVNGAPPGAARAPDISSMSPREQAAALFDRVMRLNEEGKRDSVLFFAPMAIQAHLRLDTLDADARYDVGRVAVVAGSPDIARAQADTILRAAPTHLLGLLLAIDAAKLRNDAPARRELELRFQRAEPSEYKRELPEYLAHRADILAAKRSLPPAK